MALWVAGAAAAAAEATAWITGDETSAAIGGLRLVAVVLAGRRPLVKAWVALRNSTLGIDVLMTLAVVGAVIIGQWPEAAMVTFLFGVAEAVEGYSLDRARNAIAALLELAPEQATVLRGEAWVEVPAAQVLVEDTIRVRAESACPSTGSSSPGGARSTRPR